MTPGLAAKKMKTGWWSIELPGYRPHPHPATYSLFSFDELPLLQPAPSDDFAWLRSEPIKPQSLARPPVSDKGLKPSLDRLPEIAAKMEVALPRPFTTFITDRDLQMRLRSCTDCVLELGDYPVRTSRNAGYLVPFLRDSQGLFYWHLFVGRMGEHCVVTSDEPFGFTWYDEQAAAYGPVPEVVVERRAGPIWYCADSFTEFIYRFWLENEIWYALDWDKRPLTALEAAYASQYRRAA
jgi:hypothetical protein